MGEKRRLLQNDLICGSSVFNNKSETDNEIEDERRKQIQKAHMIKSSSYKQGTFFLKML